MIPKATWLRGLTGNEIRRQGNISKPELPLIPPPLGRLQLRPAPGIQQRSRWGGEYGKELCRICEGHTSVSPTEHQTGRPQTFSCLPPAPPPNFPLEPPPCAKTSGKRRGVRGGVKTGSSYLNWTAQSCLDQIESRGRDSPIPPLWWNSDSIPLSISARRPVSASQPGLATP